MKNSILAVCFALTALTLAAPGTATAQLLVFDIRLMDGEAPVEGLGGDVVVLLYDFEGEQVMGNGSEELGDGWYRVSFIPVVTLYYYWNAHIIDEDIEAVEPLEDWEPTTVIIWYGNMLDNWQVDDNR